MIKTFPSSAPAGAALWLDLNAPTAEERTMAEAVFGAELPTREALSEIETSSRIRSRNGVLFMSVPSSAPPPTGEPAGSPVGFVLSRDRLITVRYTPSPAFEAVAKRFDEGEPASTTALSIFVELCEEIVDRIADGLEHIAEELGPMSMSAFHSDDVKGRQAVRSTQALRVQLRTVGRLGDRLSELRDTLVGLNRIVGFTSVNAEGASELPIKPRLSSLTQDIASLNDYNAQLFTRIQFLLDALVGLIGIAQNDIFKVLTVFSIVGIPPTLIASLYGMNFKNMPELSWTFGYQYGLVLIVLSALIPALWFKAKGWF